MPTDSPPPNGSLHLFRSSKPGPVFSPGVWQTPLGSLLDRDPDRLQVGVLLERMQRLVAAEARLLEAAERRGDVAAVEAVHPDDAGAELTRDAVRTRDVARPHR